MPNDTWTVGTLFSHEGARFRATGFLRVESYAITCDGPDDIVTGILRELIVEEGKDPDNLKRLVYCAPEEATVVSGRGVCGCLVRLSEVTPEGIVGWPEDILAEDRTRAARKHGVPANHLGPDIVARLSPPCP